MLDFLIKFFLVYLHLEYCMFDGGRFCFFHPILFFLFDMLCGGSCLVEERSVGVSFLIARKCSNTVEGHACKPQNTTLTILHMAVLSSQVSE